MKIKHVVTGVVAEVDDVLGKRLVADSPEWGSARAPRAPKEPTNDK